jgi:hypothetical protein
MDSAKWLLFFHTLPAKPVAARMKVWRRLNKTGALHLKGSVYLLPHSDQHQELLTWLTQEIETLGGEADFVTVERTAALDAQALVALFQQARAQAYRALEPEVEALARTLASPRAQQSPDLRKKLASQLRRLRDQQQDLARIDFFAPAPGAELGRRLAALEEKLLSLQAPGQGKPGRPLRQTVTPRRNQDYQGRTWVTRPRPFVDRMASAWLIRRFIDAKARFAFPAEGAALPAGAVGFDLPGGEFSHLGDWCTFEVLVKAFGLKDKALARLARIVHELDLHDGKFNVPQARGAEEILRGISRTAKNDREALNKGMDVFEMLFASLT